MTQRRKFIMSEQFSSRGKIQAAGQRLYLWGLLILWKFPIAIKFVGDFECCHNGMIHESSRTFSQTSHWFTSPSHKKNANIWFSIGDECWTIEEIETLLYPCTNRTVLWEVIWNWNGFGNSLQLFGASFGTVELQGRSCCEKMWIHQGPKYIRRIYRNSWVIGMTVQANRPSEIFSLPFHRIPCYTWRFSLEFETEIHFQSDFMKCLSTTSITLR
jgi:hypothetical protein